MASAMLIVALCRGQTEEPPSKEARIISISDLIRRVKEATMSKDPKIRREAGREVRHLLETFVGQVQTLSQKTTVSPVEFTPLFMNETFAKKLLRSFGTPLHGLGAQT